MVPVLLIRPSPDNRLTHKRKMRMTKFWNSDETRRRMLSRFVLAASLLVVALGANTAAAAGPVKGLEFTIGGPAFSEPVHFVVPAAKVKLTHLLYASNFT